MLITAGLVFWWPVLNGTARSLALLQPPAVPVRGVRESVFLGLALTWLPSFYRTTRRPHASGGSRPTQDQNVGGALMTGEQSSVFVAGMCWVFFRLLDETMRGGDRLRAPSEADGLVLGQRAELAIGTTALATERHGGPRGDQVVEDQQLDERERLGAVQLGADRELAEALARAGGVAKCIRSQIASSIAAARRGRSRPGSQQALARRRSRPASCRRARRRSSGDRSGCGRPVAQRQLGVEVLVVAVVPPGQERHDDVGVALAAGG